MCKLEMNSSFQRRSSLPILLFVALAVSSCFAQTDAVVTVSDLQSHATARHETKEPSDSAFLENAAQLAAQAQQAPPQTDANVIELADITVERMLPSAQTVVHSQQVIYIASEHGARDYSTRSVQYYFDSQQLAIVHARIYKSNGTVENAIDAGESSVSNIKEGLFYDTRSRNLHFPALARGDVIELEYRISPKSVVNPFADYFGSLTAFQNDVPQQLHRYVLIAPNSRFLNIVEQHLPPAQVLMSNAQTTFCWEMRDIPALKNEPRGPALTEVAPYVNVSTFANWTELGRWYAAMIRPQFHLDADLRQAVARLESTTSSDLDRIHAVHEFVLRNTRYQAMEYGVFRYKPYPVSQVYTRHYGDCKDKASLMVAMLHAMGIDAQLALVRTRKLGDVSDHATSLSMFDHAVAYIPKYDLWLDGTAEYAGFHELPLDDQGSMALTIDVNGQSMLRRIPITQPTDNYTRRVVRAEVQLDGKILFNGSAYTRGEDAPGLRREYEVAAHQRDTMRANLAQVYPTVKVDSVQVKGADNLEHDIDVNFSGSLDTFSGQKTLSLVPSWLPHRYVASLAPLKSRTEELQLPAPWTTDEELHFVLPASASLDTIPADWTDNTPFGTASIRYRMAEHELIVDTSVQFRQLRISPAEYPGFRQFCQDVEKAFHQEITVRLPQEHPAKAAIVASK